MTNHTPNEAQKSMLAKFGARGVHDLSLSRRLEYANLADTPDEPKSVAAPERVNDVQRQYLGGRSEADLDALEKSIFDSLATKPVAPVATAPKPDAGIPGLSPAKIATLTDPTKKVEIANLHGLVARDYRERAAGIPEHLRSVARSELEHAKQVVEHYT